MPSINNTTTISPIILSDGSIVFSGNLSIGGNRLTNVSSPVNDNDLINKQTMNSVLLTRSNNIKSPTLTASIDANSSSVIASISLDAHKSIKWNLSVTDTIDNAIYYTNILSVYNQTPSPIIEFSLFNEISTSPNSYYINITTVDNYINFSVSNGSNNQVMTSLTYMGIA